MIDTAAGTSYCDISSSCRDTLQYVIHCNRRNILLRYFIHDTGTYISITTIRHLTAGASQYYDTSSRILGPITTIRHPTAGTFYDASSNPQEYLTTILLPRHWDILLRYIMQQQGHLTTIRHPAAWTPYNTSSSCRDILLPYVTH